MLRLVHEMKAKKAAQKMLAQIVKNSVPSQGAVNVGFRGGNVDREVFSYGEGELWASISRTPDNAEIAKFWNAFGIFAERPVQHITVEINVPAPSNSWQVAGAFAEDEETGDIYLMHDGAVGGGRKGIGKNAFLLWSRIGMVDVLCEDGRVREAIPVGNMADDDFVGRLSRFATKVADFKAAVKSGELSTPAFKKRIEEDDRYNREFSGTKRGSRARTASGNAVVRSQRARGSLDRARQSLDRYRTGSLRRLAGGFR